MELLKKTIKLSPVKVTYTSGNNIPSGVVMKRDVTQREARHILENILGFNITDEIEGLEPDEREDFRNEYTDVINKYIKGEADWPYLCEACCCYDDVDCISYAPFLWMVSYLQEKGII